MYTNVYVCSMYICMAPSIIVYCVERVCMMPSIAVYCVERVCMVPSIIVYCVERVCMVPSIIVYCVERVCMMPSIISECFLTGCHWATPRIRIRDKEISCDDICISLYHSHHSMLYVGIHLPHLSMFDRPRCLAEPPTESLCYHIFAAGHIAYYNITLFACHRFLPINKSPSNLQPRENSFRELNKCRGFVQRRSLWLKTFRC